MLLWGFSLKSDIICLRKMSKGLLPRSFMVLSLTFKSLIHFEFVLVYDVRGGLV